MFLFRVKYYIRNEGMKKNNLFNFLFLILILGIAACSSQEEDMKSAQQEVVQKETVQKERVSRAAHPGETISREAGPGNRLSKEEQESLTQRMEENQKLFEIAKSGKNKNKTYIRLTSENNFTDTLSENLTLSRDGTSGPGTGKIIGKGFEFAEGTCNYLNSLSDTEKKRIRWRKRINKCKSKILENDWCARLKDDPTKSYNLTFLSWTISNKECVGACEEHDFQTAYIRVKTDYE